MFPFDDDARRSELLTERSERPQAALWVMALVCAALGSAAPSAAESTDLLSDLGEGDAPRVRVLWIDEAPTLDGHFDEPFWNEAVLLDRFVQAVPDTGEPSSQRTEVRIATDEEALYVAVRCWDSEPDKIVSRRMLRDDELFFDDRFNIVIDTFQDKRNGYFFQVTSNGSRRDGLIEGPLFERNWDGVWSAEVQKDSRGWQAEIRLPYRTVSFDPNKDAWGLNFERGIRRRDELSRWADPVPQRSVINVSNAGTLEGLRGIQQGIGLDIAPSVTTRYVRDPFDRGLNAFDFDTRSYWRSDPSVDVFYKLTSGLTATLTVNTDFGETEVDARQVNLDRFDLFFPEKRDFFLQDGLIFNFANLDQNGRPFFSRRIGIAADGEPSEIRAGVKVTGRAGRFKIGLLNAQVEGHHVTRIGGDFAPPNEFNNVNVDSTNVTVARIAANIFEESTIGGIFTYGDPRTNDENWVAGADFNYRTSHFLGNKVLAGRAYYMHSDTTPENCNELTAPGGDCKPLTITSGQTDGGDAYGFQLEYPNDRANWRVSMNSFSADFNPALGFVNRRNIRSYNASYRARHRPQDDEFWRTVEAQADGQLITDLNGTIETGRVEVTPLRITTDIAGLIEVRYRHRYEFIREAFDIGRATIERGRYHFDEGIFRISTSNNRALRGELEIAGGTFFRGERLRIVSSLQWRPNHHWLLAAEVDENRLWVPGRDTTTTVVRLRLNIQFTPHIAWLTFAQYDNVSDTVGINSRFRWIVSDGREFFIVLNQGIREIGGELEAGRTEPLAKIGWLFRF